MRPNKASRTAQYMALYRALETSRPRGKRLFTDPYAIRFLGAGLRFACLAAKIPPLAALVDRYIQRRIPGSLSSGIARTRYIDDLVEGSLVAGSGQLIIVGAGFDTRALRLQSVRGIPVTEVDHPDTATRKLERLGKLVAGLTIRYLQVDLNQQSLEECFAAAGIDYGIRTTIIWEGVTNYLEKEAIDKTFALAARFARGSCIIFTYVDRQVLERPGLFHGGERLIRDLEDIGERWTFGFRPEELPAYLSQFGWQLREDLGAGEYRLKYMRERKVLLKGYEFYRVAMAEN